jgi:hypothetical protein
LSSLLLRWMPPVVLSRNKVRVIGDRRQSCRDMRGRLDAPPCRASTWLVKPVYICPSRPLSFSACISCSPIHVRYAFLREKGCSAKHIVWQLGNGIGHTFRKSANSFVQGD